MKGITRLDVVVVGEVVVVLRLRFLVVAGVIAVVLLGVEVVEVVVVAVDVLAELVFAVDEAEVAVVVSKT